MIESKTLTKKHYKTLRTWGRPPRCAVCGKPLKPGDRIVHRQGHCRGANLAKYYCEDHFYASPREIPELLPLTSPMYMEASP